MAVTLYIALAASLQQPAAMVQQIIGLVDTEYTDRESGLTLLDLVVCSYGFQLSISAALSV